MFQSIKPGPIPVNTDIQTPNAIASVDRVQQGLAIFQAGHASSPSRKIAESFFDRTSKAAVSANALSVRLKSRSSSSAAPSSRGSPSPPSASCHRGGRDHRFEPCRRGPLPRAATSIIGGRGGGTPTLRGRDADADRLRDDLKRRALGWQQAGHHHVFELLSVASHARRPVPRE